MTDEMLLAAARALARQVSEADLQDGRVFPVAERMREVGVAVAAAVPAVAFDQGLAVRPRSADLSVEARCVMYLPTYV